MSGPRRRDDVLVVRTCSPPKVEDLISGHPDAVEAAAIGVDDKESLVSGCARSVKKLS